MADIHLANRGIILARPGAYAIRIRLLPSIVGTQLVLRPEGAFDLGPDPRRLVLLLTDLVMLSGGFHPPGIVLGFEEPA